MSVPAVAVRALDFGYANSPAPVLHQVSLELPVGARCLVVGRNGAGKSTLLEVMAGHHMIPPATVEILGRPAFHDTSLCTRVSFIGGSFPFDADIAVDEILAAQRPSDPARRALLLRTLEIDLRWRMSRVSTGQRRRVQILLGLLHPREVLLLDEITTDLDLVARIDLLALLREQSEQSGVTILHATHIFDRGCSTPPGGVLDGWATHVLHIDHGRVRRLIAADEIEGELLPSIEGWLRGARAATS